MTHNQSSPRLTSTQLLRLGFTRALADRRLFLLLAVAGGLGSRITGLFWEGSAGAVVAAFAGLEGNQTTASQNEDLFASVLAFLPLFLFGLAAQQVILASVLAPWGHVLMGRPPFVPRAANTSMPVLIARMAVHLLTAMALTIAVTLGASIVLGVVGMLIGAISGVLTPLAVLFIIGVLLWLFAVAHFAMVCELLDDGQPFPTALKRADGIGRALFGATAALMILSYLAGVLISLLMVALLPGGMQTTLVVLVGNSFYMAASLVLVAGLFSLNLPPRVDTDSERDS